MLVLSRKLQQQIKIGDQITVTILRVKGNTVRVGIAAPRDLRVIRGELPKNDDAVNAEATIECESVITLTGDESAEISDSADDSTDAKGSEPAASAAEHAFLSPGASSLAAHSQSLRPRTSSASHRPRRPREVAATTGSGVDSASGLPCSNASLGIDSPSP